MSDVQLYGTRDGEPGLLPTLEVVSAIALLIALALR